MTLIESLTDDILADEYFHLIFAKCSMLNANQTFNKSEIQEKLSIKELKDSLRFADILSNSKNSEARNKAYQIITFLNSNYSSNPTYCTVSKAVYSKLGNFPAINYLETRDNNMAEIPFIRMVETEAKRLIQTVPDSEDKVFTDSQYELYSKLSNSLSYSFSGPTSMGKSFIIMAFIRKALKNSPPENLVILVPTRALINQFTLDLKKELKDILDQYRYKVVTNSNINDLITTEPFNYILVLTPERLISYLSQNGNPSIGFLFVDEAHKLAQIRDARSVTTYVAIEKAINKYGGNLKLYFSSPNVSNPQVFLKLFNKETVTNSFKTNESPVSQNLYFIDLIQKKIELVQSKSFDAISIKDFDRNFSSITDVINYLGKGENNLIYNNSKAKTILGAKEFSKSMLKSQILSENIQKAVLQIREYVHPDYYLAELLEKEIAYHHGKLPQLIRNIVEDLYKNEEVRNVFCTSTLLEGVNMPTKNLFILNNQNGLGKLEDIDFWNLSGRAGRLNKELFGNIYCIKHDGCQWENKDEILLKKSIELTPTVVSKIDKNIRKIEKVLLEQDISGTEVEKEILKYIANIICIDSLEIRTTYKSPIIEQLIANNKEKILALAKNKTKNITVPQDILNSNQSINVTRQQKIYTKLLQDHAKGKTIKLPSSSGEKFYTTCLGVLNEMYVLYDWGKAEKRIQTKASLSYFATIMTQWIKGFSLSQIINQSIEYHEEKQKKIQIDYNTYIPFEKGNVQHINIVIESVIDDIEFVLRFVFEKYFNHYHQILIKILGEESAGENWATLLEYGTQNRIVIALQNIGLSRHTATSIYNKCRDALVIKESKLVSIKKEIVLRHFNPKSLEFDEIYRLL